MSTIGRIETHEWRRYATADETVTTWKVVDVETGETVQDGGGLSRVEADRLAWRLNYDGNHNEEVKTDGNSSSPEGQEEQPGIGRGSEAPGRQGQEEPRQHRQEEPEAEGLTP